MNNGFDTFIKVRLPSALKERLETVAERRMIGVSDIIREQALAYLALNEPAGFVPRALRRKKPATTPASAGNGASNGTAAEEKTGKPA